jgi:uncharacterized protein involved in outer membrane biogenesis
MKLWKSPVLYFGILLVLAVVAALIAPHVVTWDSYRADIEAYGRKLTGRPVTVRGPIQVTLFPWPNITLGDVRVANPEGAGSPDFMAAQKVSVSVTLAGLASGQMRVESIDVERPEFWAERLANGVATWTFAPEINLLGTEFSERFRLDRIVVRNAKLHMIESRRGGEATLENISATLSGAEMRGPWRLRGSGEYLGRSLDIALNTGIWRPDAPFKFGLRLQPSDGSGLAYSLDGGNTGERFEGTLRIEPAAGEGGKSDAEGALRPLVFNSRIVADFDRIALAKIEIAPRGSDGANLLGGSAEISLGEDIRLSSDLSATRFDLDAIAGAQLRRLVREGNSLDVLEALVDLLPQALEAQVRVKVVSLIAGGESLENVVVALRAGGGTIRIDEFSGKMPGQAQGLFSGVFAATDKGPQLAGDLAFEAFNLRDFVSWLAPEHKAEIARAWTGSRGMLKFEGRVDAAGSTVRVSNAAFQIDDTLGKAAASWSGGARSAADFDIQAETIDVDAFLPQGVQVFSTGGASGWTDLASLLAPVIPDVLNIKLTADRVRLNGVDAGHVMLDAASNAAGIAINALRADSFGQAQFEASGQVSLGAGGPAGTGLVALRAADPRGLLRLLGLLPAGREPGWAGALGATDVKLVVDLNPEGSGPALVADFNGTSGEIFATGRAALLEGLDWKTATVTGTAEVSSPKSSAVAQLFGWTAPEAAPVPGRLSAAVSGSLDKGLTTDLSASLFGAEIKQKGTLHYADGLSAEGDLAAIADRSGDLIAALGLPVAAEGPLRLSGRFDFTGGALSLSTVTGTWMEVPMSGRAAISAAGVITGEFAAEEIRLPAVLSAMFLPWDGRPADAETSFARAWPLGLTGELWLRPQRLFVFGDYAVTDSQLGLAATAEGKRIAVFGTAPSGGKVSFEAGISPRGEGFALDATVDLPAELASVMSAERHGTVAAGLARVQVKLAGEGRSPAAAQASARGGGSYSIANLRLSGIDVAAFRSGLAQAKTAEDVRAALAAMVGGGMAELGDVEGPITIVDGVAALMPVKVSSADYDLSIRPLVETATGSVDIGMDLSLKGERALPPMTISYAGAPDALVRSVDAAALESQLGMEVLQKAMRELEAVQREQQRVLEEEARQARIDAERLADWEAHRKELQRRQREMKVHQRTRDDKARAYAEWLAELGRLVKPEMAQRNRELRMHRRLRLAATQTPKAIAPAEPAVITPPANDKSDLLPGEPAKTQPKPRTAAKPAPAETGPVTPLVLVPPAEPLPMPPPGEPLVLVPPAEPKPRTLFDFFTQIKKKPGSGD